MAKSLRNSMFSRLSKHTVHTEHGPGCRSEASCGRCARQKDQTRLLAGGLFGRGLEIRCGTSRNNNNNGESFILEE